MKIILAPDSFKGTFSAPEVCRAFESGIRSVFAGARFNKLPLADGGEGTLDVLLAAAGGRRCRVMATDPLGREIEVEFAVLAGNDEALVEMARVSGLALLEESRRNPWIVGTYGLGQVVKAALDQGVSSLALTLGGSATVDCGVGMARALGYCFLDRKGNPLELEGGRILGEIARIDCDNIDPRLEKVRSRALCDVKNPLLGSLGAARVFAPQKGADRQMVERLEAGLANLALRIEEDLGVKVADLPGSGAAGGLGAAEVAFLGGTLVPGIKYVLDALEFAGALEQADLVLTGEGSFDSQSLGGKVISGVLELAGEAQVPVIVVCGRYKQAEGTPLEDRISGKPGLPAAVFSGADLAGSKGEGGMVSLEELSELAGKAVEWWVQSRKQRRK